VGRGLMTLLLNVILTWPLFALNDVASRDAANLAATCTGRINADSVLGSGSTQWHLLMDRERRTLAVWTRHSLHLFAVFTAKLLGPECPVSVWH
jgi:hypothetical protein